jgi:glycerol-3-phosphate dehydrogenase (NAD(P)+)
MRFGILGSGSWATALAKMLADNKNEINWLLRNEQAIEYFSKRGHNPNYLTSVNFNTALLKFSTDVSTVVAESDIVLIATPSAYVEDTLKPLSKESFKSKKVLSAIKGITPTENILLNEYLFRHFDLPLENYFTVMGPCHAEEVAGEKLSYLTFSGLNENEAEEIASNFKTDYINTVVNHDVIGVQYAAVLKNIYALGAGLAHGLEYGDNFLSVLIANCADEMAGFLKNAGIEHMVVGEHESEDPITHRKSPNYAASVYLGDLLVTCYSLFSRNRTFGAMIGKGYSVKAAQLEMNMVAEGYNASRCIYEINKQVKADMPIAKAIYQILWEQLPAQKGFKQIEEVLI